MSAKVNYCTKTIVPPTPSLKTKRSTMKRSYLNIRSSKSIASVQNNKTENRKNRYRKQNTQNHFFALRKGDEQNVNEQMINQMRKRKIRESEDEHEKNAFFRNVKIEQQKNNKINKKWIQLMGSKTYYYNNNG